MADDANARVNSEAVSEASSPLRREDVSNLPARIREIEELWIALKNGPEDANTLRRLQRLVRDWARSLGSAGLTGSETSVHRLSDALRDDSVETGVSRAARIRRVDGQVDALKRLGAGEAPWSPAPVVSIARPSADPASREASRLIYLVESDAPLAATLTLQLGCYGYSVTHFASVDEMDGASRGAPPAAWVVDLVALEWADAVQRVRRSEGVAGPVVFVSERNDLTVRLEAVRAGGRAFVTKPVDVHDLVEAIERLVLPRPVDPYRVLVVEDDVDQASQHALILRSAGMQVYLVMDPMAIMSPLVDFQPDLVLMGIHMPGGTGIELAAAIRQQPAYLGIPIVFVDRDAAPRDRSAALRMGGEEYMTHPIAPDYLVDAVAARADRSRVLRAMMVRDGLTGLLNHARIQDALETEVARAHRQGTPLSCLLFDLDRFRSVNEAHGYTAGDRVLKNFACMLRQRLRRTDLLGRYGGDQFMVLLPGANGSSAATVADTLREGWARVAQRSFQELFTVTVSVGVAALAPGGVPRQMAEDVNRALFQAKEAGRNQVVLSR